ncbi:MAG: hypothetical protein IPM55_24050 [Acidobacteria bacterium]|nr:hypothetical protein [Acidobacteriota bacterium]
MKDLAADESRWTFHPSLSSLSPVERSETLRVLLDHFRRKLAINNRILQETNQQQIRRRSEQNLNEFWGLDSEINQLRTSTRFVLTGTSNRGGEGISLGERSALGRYLRTRLGVTSNEYPNFISDILNLTISQGFLSAGPSG